MSRWLFQSAGCSQHRGFRKLGEEGKWILPQTPEEAQPRGHQETNARVGIGARRECVQTALIVAMCCYNAAGKLISALVKREESPVCQQSLT